MHWFLSAKKSCGTLTTLMTVNEQLFMIMNVGVEYLPIPFPLYLSSTSLALKAEEIGKKEDRCVPRWR